jgi:hypothetical protein
LLTNNEIPELRTKLNKLTYTTDEIKAITFLNSLKALGATTAPTLKKAQKNAKVSPEQIKKFGKIANINTNLIDAFNKFELSVNGQDVMDRLGIKKGPEVGLAIQSLEVQNFKKLL